MLSNVHAQKWNTGLVAKNFDDHTECNQKTVKSMLSLAKDYNARVQEEEKKTAEEIMIENVGKIDPKRHLKESVDALMADNIDQSMTSSLDTIVFK